MEVWTKDIEGWLYCQWAPYYGDDTCHAPLFD